MHSSELGVRLEGMLVHWPALKQTKKLSKVRVRVRVRFRVRVRVRPPNGQG